MVDYRKFDNIEDSDEEVVDDSKLQYGMRKFPVHYPPAVPTNSAPPSSSSSGTTASASSPSPIDADLETRKVIPMAKRGQEGRIRYEHEGRLIYEWEQNLNEVLIYITPPPGINKKLLHIDITNRHVVVGIANSPPYIDEDTGGLVKVSESLWQLDDGELVINLQKMHKAEAWDCALIGKGGEALDAHTKEEVRKKLMLERFQEEHPGFDFSNAEFNGQVPEARTFMGGVKYS